MRFEPNGGRISPATDYVARGAGYAVFLSPTGTTVVVAPAARGKDRDVMSGTSAPPAHVSMRLAGSRADATATAHHQLPGRTNSVQGSDRSKWITGLTAYERVEYRGVYPGIDVVYYGNQQQLEYDFVVAPGASVADIAIEFSGQTGLSIDDEGGLVIATTAGNLVQRPPVIYQQDAGGSRQMVNGGYALGEGGRVGFRVGGYDSQRPLVIDPVLGYSTYLGGSGGDEAASIAVDAAGDVYITGQTGSLDFPVLSSSHAGDYYDAFVLKLSGAGDTLVYSTYLGGSGNDFGADIHVDDQHNAFVAGTTFSSDFPLAGPFQPALAGHSDIFLTRLDPSGVPLYSTYLGGRDQDVASGLAVDVMGRPYVTGWTFSPDFPTRNALQSRLGGSPAFKTTDGGSTWSAIGSGLNATQVQAIAIDAQNTATLYAGTQGDGVYKSVDGGTSWTAFNSGLNDRFVYSLLASSTSASVFAGTETGLYRSVDAGASWHPISSLTGRITALAGDPTSPSTLYAAVVSWNGGAGVFKTTDGGETWVDVGIPEYVNSIAVSASSPMTLFVGTLRGAFKSTTGGSDWVQVGDEFTLGNTRAVGVDPGNPAIVYAATDLGVFRSVSGGSDWTLTGNFGQVLNLAISPSAPSVVYASTGVGAVISRDGGETWEGLNLGEVIAWALAVDPQNADVVYAGSAASIDGILARFNVTGSTLEFSTFFGGSSFDAIADVDVDAAGHVYILGQTASADLQLTNPLQPQFGGVRDLFVARLTPSWQPVYATYLGGTGWEHGTTLAVDGLGHVHVAGETYSQDFPRVNAHQPDFGGGFVDAFVTKLAPNGASLVYSTLLGGSDSESLVTLALAPSGGVVVSGTTGSLDFPTLEAAQEAHGGGFIDMFVSSFSQAGELRWSTFLGGDGWDYNRRVAVAASGHVWVTGDSESSDFPTRDPLQPAKGMFSDLVVARLDPAAIDNTPPVTSLRAFGDQGPGGWYVTPVSIEIEAVDDRSGVAGIEYQLNDGPWMPYSTPFSITASGTTQVRARAADQAGNVESPGASASFNVDLDGPVVTIGEPESRTYLHSEALTIAFSAADSGSGLSGTPVAGLDRTLVTNGQVIPLLTLPLGPHHFSVSARDVAGHGTKQSASFEIVATIGSLIDAVQVFVANGGVDASTAGALLAKLEDTRQAMARGNTTSARNKLEDFINFVMVRTDRGVRADAAAVLVADARYVLATLQ